MPPSRVNGDRARAREPGARPDTERADPGETPPKGSRNGDILAIFVACLQLVAPLLLAAAGALLLVLLLVKLLFS